jgi:alpha/beta superfamily hydrolase
MNSRTHQITITGPVGCIELSIDLPDTLQTDPNFAVRGLALIAHPHPLLGGTKDNKVVQTLARTFNQLAYVSVRPNFRGVGLSAGVHDEGRGELSDLLLISDWMRTPQSWLPHINHASERFVMVGSAAGKWKLADSVPADTIVIHGETDETIPLLAVFDWARPQELTVHVVPGADHFFHRKLHCIRNIILSHWLGQAPH